MDKPRLIIEYEGILYEFLVRQAGTQMDACRRCAFADSDVCNDMIILDCTNANDFIEGEQYAWRLL